MLPYFDAEIKTLPNEMLTVSEYILKYLFFAIKMWRGASRHEDFFPFVALVLPAPWVLKGGGLESFGLRLISLNSKTKRIIFLGTKFFFIFFLFNFYLCKI